MRKLLRAAIYTMAILLINAGSVEPSSIGDIAAVSPGIAVQSDVTVVQPLEHLTGALASAKRGDLVFCLGYIKSSKDNNHDIANFILTWSPEAYRKRIPSVFRSKIDRIVKKLSAVDYQQLIIDIDFIKNSQLTVGQMVKLIKGTKIGSRSKAK